jgi:hypothetical protein
MARKCEHCPEAQNRSEALNGWEIESLRLPYFEGQTRQPTAM